MKDIKAKLDPMFKILDQLDKEAILAIAGVMFLMTLILGGIADVFAMLVGVVIGIALYKKFLG